MACLLAGLAIVLLVRPVTLVHVLGTALVTAGLPAGVHQLRTSRDARVR